MFSNINKPAFGTGTTTPSFGFGTTSTANQTPFGQSQLFGKTATTSGFGATAPLFGSTAQQPSGALFSSTSVPSFGTAPQTGFGTSLFGQQQNPAGGNGLFATTNAPNFGQQTKTAGFGFGTASATPLFGQQQPQNFQPSTSAGVFGGAGGFGATAQSGTVIKFNPVTGTDTMQKSGITHSISTKHHCITCMKEYEAKSLEELRWEDYQSNRRGPQQQNSFGAPPFGAPASTAPSLFGQTENKPAFGQSTTFGAGNGFGLTSQPNQQPLFGKPAGTFGATPTTNTFGGFNTSTPAFGANAGVKPFGAQATQNVFGAPTTQPSTFGGTFFGQANPPNTGSFFNKPAQTAFNTQQPVFTFGQQTTAQSSLFQPSKATTGFPSFGQTNLTSNSGFGQQPNLFSQAPQNPFNAFQKPAQTAFGQPLQPGFGLGTQPGTNTFFGANKPLFGGATQSNFFTPPSGGFMMQQQQQPAANPCSLELQPQPDFHTIVEQLYETFPHREIFDGIQVKSYSSTNETTNPTILREIIENAPLPMSPPDNISKLRILPKPKRSTGASLSKFSLLDNIVPPTPLNDFVLKSSTGKRLVLRKTTPRSDKDTLEEYKSMAAAEYSRNRSLFKSTVLEELNRNEAAKFNISDREQTTKSKSPVPPQEDILSPLSSRRSYDRDVMKENNDKIPPLEQLQLEKDDQNVDEVSKNQGTQTAQKTGLQKIKRKRFPLLNIEDSDSESQEEETEKTVPLKSPETKESIQNSEIVENTKQSSKGEKDNGGKSVRFVDNVDSNTRGDAAGSLLQRHMEMLDEDAEDPSSGSEDEDPNLPTLRRTLKINPCGIKSTRPDYYTIPPLDELHKYRTENGSCIVKGFTVGRYGYGNVFFHGEVDVANLDLDDIVHFRYRELTLYPDESKKPPVWQGLNRPAQITLDHVWPRDPITRQTIKDPKEISADNFLDRLVLLTEKQHGELVDYRPETGSWIFSVQHFSKYRFSEVEDELTRRQREREREELLRRHTGHGFMVVEEGGSTSEPEKRGLGGIPMELDEISDTPVGHTSLRQTFSKSRLASAFRDESKSAMMMKAAFFDEESISEDATSSDIGIVHHFSVPTAPISASRAYELPKKTKALQPKYYALKNLSCVAPMRRPYPRNYMDMAIFKGRSFKVGWGPGFTITTVTTRAYPFDTDVVNQVHCDYKPSVIKHLNIAKLGVKPEVMDLEKHLEIIFKESTMSTDNSGLPLFTINKGITALLHHRVTSACLDRKRKLNISYYSEVWNLCEALWGPTSNTPTEKLELFSKWLEDSATPYIRNEVALYNFQTPVVMKNIFSYLTGHKIELAAELAMVHGLPRLSALISQASANDSVRRLVHHQLAQWKSDGVLYNIDRVTVKIYMLLGGIPVIDNLNVCENLNWKRALAIHLWYICPPGISLIYALLLYKQAFELVGYCDRPTPENFRSVDVQSYDVMYNILQLFTNLTTPLQKIIDPTSYTEDLLDYRLSWLLMQLFSAMKIGTASQKIINAAHVSFATQLEDLGLWKWSVFVLLFIKDKSARKNAVMRTLDRHLDSDRTSEENLKIEDSLVNDFKIPSDWIHTILANQTRTQCKYVESYKHLILTKSWFQAHQMAFQIIIPDFISSGQCEKLPKLLELLIPGRHKCLHWERQVGLIIDFLKLHEKIIVKREVTDLDSIKLQSNLMPLCRGIKFFPTGTLKQKITAAELSKFISVLLKILYCDLQPPTEENLRHATNIISILNMPADYKIDDLLQYFFNYIRFVE